MALFYYKEKKNKGIRAAAYLRLSIEDGDKAESNSIGNQRELIQNFVAERPELHLVGEYADDGYTGTNFERPGFTVSKKGKKYIYLNCVTNHKGLGCSSHHIRESKLEEVVLAALQEKIQQISGLEERLDEINEIPKNQRRLKSVEEHMKVLEQEEQKCLNG